MVLSQTLFGSRQQEFILALLQNLGFLDFKDSQFVEDVLTDISHFYEGGDSYRVLLFPPFQGYHRLLIHKSVETHYLDLITFSVGAQQSRRTVVAFVEACHRGEKGIQLLSKPKEEREQRPSKWRNLTGQERVANWVRLRELKNHKREIWNSAKSLDSQDSEDAASTQVGGASQENDRMEQERTKKQAAGIYVPPFLREKKAVEGQEKPMASNNSETGMTEKEGPHSADSTDVKSNSTGEREEEVKRPRGRGRGRRKPEIQVYVPRALRGANQGLHKTKPGEQSDQDRDASGLETAVSEKYENVFHDIGNECSLDDQCCTSEMSRETSVSSLLASESPGDDHLPPTVSNISAKTVEESSSDNRSPKKSDAEITNDLKFEFYDPAIVAFLPATHKPSVVAMGDVPNESGNASRHEEQRNNSNIVLLSPGDLEKQVQDVVSETCMKDCTGDALMSEVEMKKEMIEDEERKDFMYQTKEENSKIETVSDTYSPKMGNPSESAIANEKESPGLPKTKSKLKQKKTKKSKEGKEKESLKPKVKDTRSEAKEPCGPREPKEEKSKEQNVGEDNGDSWDTLFDDEGDCLDDSLLADITAHVGKVTIDKPKIDYLSYIPKEQDMDFEVYSHILEIYDFPSEFGTHDIVGSFKDFLSKGFDIKWVDDTHALGIFSSAIAAKEALRTVHPMVKVRPMSAASRQGLSKAKSGEEFLQPYKARPQTTSMAARRLVAGALGMAPRVSKEVREEERNKLKAAKEKRRQEKQQKVDMWDGSFGKCAMDDVS